MKKTLVKVVLSTIFVMTSFAMFFYDESFAFDAEIQKNDVDAMLATPAGMPQNISTCSKSFVESLNKNNTVIWINDPKYPGTGVPCCMKGLVCQPYPDYKNYVIAMPTLQSEYDCSKIAKDCGYTPICKVVVGESLDPTTICAECVPYRFRFWATVYQNNNAPNRHEPSVSSSSANPQR